jgi:hypothetical protein
VIALPAPTVLLPRPVSERAQDRHRDLADIATLEAWVRANPARIMELVRRPFTGRSLGDADMRMPPFMRNSDARELTLSHWQYDLLMAWVASVTGPAAGVAAVATPPPQNLSGRASARRNRVLESLGDQP